MDLFDRILELSREGYCCAQVLMTLLLESLGEENKALIKSLDGLSTGVGYSGGTCGCMPGGACVLSYFTGREEGSPAILPDHKEMMQEFTKWFSEVVTEEYGGTDCRVITQGNPDLHGDECMQIMMNVHEKCMEMLIEKGYVS